MADSNRPRLGELLVKDGLVTRSQLLKAITARHGVATRLGSLLVERGDLDVDTLAVALSRQLGVPAANSAMFSRAEQRAIELVPHALCSRYNIFPLNLIGNTLQLAAVDPFQTAVFLELQRGLNLQISVVVAPQVLLWRALDQQYGSARFPEATASVDDLGPGYTGETDSNNGFEITPLAADVDDNLAQATSSSGDAGIHDDFTDAELDVVFLDEITGGFSNRKQHASDDTGGSDDDFDIDISVEEDDDPDDDAASAPYDPETVINCLREATDRDSVVNCLLTPLLPQTSLVLLLVKRGDLAHALAIWGTDIAQDQLRTFVLPLSSPSVLQQACEQQTLAECNVDDDPIQVMISTFVRAKEATSGYAIPVCLGQRVINIIYVQTLSPAPIEALDDVIRIADATANAFRQLIRARRLTDGTD